MSKSAKSAASKARTDLGADALGLRVAELEAQIAQERTQGAAKAREVERAMQILRSTMQDLQVEVQRGNDERERLRIENERLHEQLHQARQNLLELSNARPAEPAPPAPEPPPTPEPVPDPRVEPLERQLEESRVAATGLRQKVAELESTVRQRERDLVAARDVAAELERKIATREFLPPDAFPAPKESATAEVRAALDVFSTTSEVAAVATKAAPAPRTASPREPDHAPEPDLPVPDPEPRESLDDPAFGSDSHAIESGAVLEIPGIRIERCVEDGPTGLVLDGREMPTRRAVTVLVLPSIGKLLEGGKLDALLLARHPNLVAVLAFGVCAAGPYLVLERHDGETCDAWVRRIGPLPEPTVLAVALEAARGLRQAASHGAFHGDLSPASVLVDASGRVRILGVGLRSVFRPGDDEPLAPEFASPERLLGTRAPDARGDVYSLGAVLWFLLTGSPPPGGDPDSSDDAPDVCAVVPDVSADTGQLLQRMLAPDPGQRHRTWDQILIDLEHRQPGVVSPELRGTFESRARRVIANRPWLLVPVLAVPLLCAFSVWQASRVSSPEERWAEARGRAERLADEGQTEAARQIYRRFLEGVGDEQIEAEAARRFEELGAR